MYRKRNKKIKRLVNDKKAVSAVVGTALMLSITVAVGGMVSVGVMNYGTAQRGMLDAQVDMMQSEIGVMERFIDYLDTLNFTMSSGNQTTNSTLPDTDGNQTTNCPLPDMEYEWNDTRNDWNVRMWWAEYEIWIQIYPPLLLCDGCLPIWPPNPPIG